MFLTKSSFSDNRAISVIGYSLGSVVAFNTMKILKRLYDKSTLKCGHILNDIQFWAGAYVLDVTKTYEEVREKSQNCSVINGNLNNLYSKTDGVLKGMPILYTGTKAIGLSPIFENIKEEDKETCKQAINYDVTIESPGHSTYGPNCGQFLHKILEFY